MSDDPAASPRFGMDELRRCAIALGVAAGLPAEKASELARLLLWFDAAGVPDSGISTLTDWLDLLDHGRCDGRATTRIVLEKPATAVVDARRMLAPLALAAAGELAGQKARESGVGVVTILNLEGVHAAGGVAADLAIGPLAAAVRGPGSRLALAIPTAAGLPAVFDSSLAAESAPAWLQDAAPLLSAPAAPADGWLIVALSIVAFEPLDAYHARVRTLLPGSETRGLTLPGPWEERRRRAGERGVPIAPAALRAIRERAARLAIPEPGVLA
jgi:LDH2 family malate/lactate/ureidoglycolate dehydrogenase